MTHYYIAFIILIGSFKTGLCTNNCTSYLRQLADNQGKYVNCMIHHASPVTACIDCYIYYSTMVTDYNMLVKIKNCSQIYINKNRFNIVYNMQKTLVQIWKEGFCDDCIDNGQESESYMVFGNFSRTLTKCLHDYPENQCTTCYPKYGDLNYFYKQMEKEKKGKICFDVQDAMNSTRSMWSKDLKCCTRDYNMTVFFIGCTLFSAIPLIFYSGMYVYTKRSERNPEILDSTFDSRNQAPVASTSSGAITGRSTNHQNRTVMKGSTVHAKEIANEKTPPNISERSGESSNENILINL